MRLTVRTRLTLVYGGLFVLAGMVLLGATYILVEQRLPMVAGRAQISTAEGVPFTPGGPAQKNVQQIVEGTQSSALHTMLTQGSSRSPWSAPRPSRWAG